MKKNNIVNVIIGTMFVSIIVLLLWIMIYEIRTEGAKCTLDPLVYGANELQKVNEHPISCECSILTGNPTSKLIFNAENKSFVDPLIIYRDPNTYP